MAVILGFDPGFRSFGWAAVDVGHEHFRVLAVGIVETKKSDKKLHVLSVSDNLSRARILSKGLRSVAAIFQPKAIAAESISFVRQASVMAQMGMAWGVIASLSISCKAPIAIASPQDIKRAATGKASASKEDVESGLALRRSIDWTLILADWPKTKHEHIVDAVGAVHACSDSEVIRAVVSALAEPTNGATLSP